MRTGKLILVWVAALMMVADPASACRWRSRSYCGPAYGYGSSYYESGCGASYESSCGSSYSSCGDGYSSSCGESVSADCSACSDGVTTNRPADAVPAEPATPQPTFEDTPAPAAPAAPETFAPPAPEPSAAPPAAPSLPTETTPAPSAPMPSTPTPTAPAPAAAPPAAAPPAAAPSTTAPPKAEVEDLFSEPAAVPATPETKPAEPAEVEDLFKEPAPTNPAPAEKPAGEVDDLFKDLDETKDGNKAAATETPAEAPATPDSNKEVEDLFSDPAPAPMSAVEKPAPTQVTETKPVNDMRTWTDNTGTYQIRGRLVVVGKTHVRILKETGKYTTVPFTRLSQTDLAFVREQADGAIVASF